MQPILHMSIAGEYCEAHWDENPEFNRKQKKQKKLIASMLELW
jgi:hypothetical protein